MATFTQNLIAQFSEWLVNFTRLLLYCECCSLEFLKGSETIYHVFCPIAVLLHLKQSQRSLKITSWGQPNKSEAPLFYCLTNADDTIRLSLLSRCIFFVFVGILWLPYICKLSPAWCSNYFANTILNIFITYFLFLLIQDLCLLPKYYYTIYL